VVKSHQDLEDDGRYRRLVLPRAGRAERPRRAPCLQVEVGCENLPLSGTDF
jgi:hypothetical protein